MNIVSLHHAPFEGLGSLESLIHKGGHSLKSVGMWEQPHLPDRDTFNLLIIMGGPMGVGEYEKYPWLAGEKEYIKEVINAGKAVLGICLGAQLLAQALGAGVNKGESMEIGWFPVERNPETDNTFLGRVLPSRFEAFHWHGDTFDIPEGSIALGGSSACPNQGFIFKDRVLGFQFHLETTLESAESLISNCPEVFIAESPYVQKPDIILSQIERFDVIRRYMTGIWEQIEKMNYN